jgi:hypothetical protein
MTTTSTMDAQQFLRDIASHRMEVLLDNGIYRHLKFRNAPPNSWNAWFELVTWPGSLAIHGDMGSWTFARTPDMFEFFRSCEGLRINASYWCEKVQSESRFGGPSRKFTAYVFEKNVRSALDDYDLSDEDKHTVMDALKEEVFGEEHEETARRALQDFTALRGFRFSDSWEIEGKGYTYHFLWCLYAIVWGIQEYDRMKAGQAEGGAA